MLKRSLALLVLLFCLCLTTGQVLAEDVPGTVPGDSPWEMPTRNLVADGYFNDQERTVIIQVSADYDIIDGPAIDCVNLNITDSTTELTIIDSDYVVQDDRIVLPVSDLGIEPCQKAMITVVISEVEDSNYREIDFSDNVVEIYISACVPEPDPDCPYFSIEQSLDIRTGVWSTDLYSLGIGAFAMPMQAEFLLNNNIISVETIASSVDGNHYEFWIGGEDNLITGDNNLVVKIRPEFFPTDSYSQESLLVLTLPCTDFALNASSDGTFILGNVSGDVSVLGNSEPIDNFLVGIFLEGECLRWENVGRDFAFDLSDDLPDGKSNFILLLSAGVDEIDDSNNKVSLVMEKESGFLVDFDSEEQVLWIYCQSGPLFDLEGVVSVNQESIKEFLINPDSGIFYDVPLGEYLKSGNNTIEFRATPRDIPDECYFEETIEVFLELPDLEVSNPVFYNAESDEPGLGVGFGIKFDVTNIGEAPYSGDMTVWCSSPTYYSTSLPLNLNNIVQMTGHREIQPGQTITVAIANYRDWGEITQSGDDYLNFGVKALVPEENKENNEGVFEFTVEPEIIEEDLQLIGVGFWNGKDNMRVEPFNSETIYPEGLINYLIYLNGDIAYEGEYSNRLTLDIRDMRKPGENFYSVEVFRGEGYYDPDLTNNRVDGSFVIAADDVWVGSLSLERKEKVLNFEVEGNSPIAEELSIKVFDRKGRLVHEENVYRSSLPYKVSVPYSKYTIGGTVEVGTLNEENMEGNVKEITPYELWKSWRNNN